MLRHIRDGRLSATRIGKSYRIEQSRLDAFAGLASGRGDGIQDVRATCVIDVPGLEAENAQRFANLLGAAAMTGDATTPPLQVTTAFDPVAKTLKVVVIARPADAARLLAMLDLQLGSGA